MKLPWTKPAEEKSASSVLVALSQLGSAQWGGRSPQALMRDGYLRNAIVHRCVRMVAEAAASIRLVSSHGEAMRLLDRPMPEDTGTTLLERLYVDLHTTGNGYLEAVFLEPGGKPAGLQTLKPTRMKANLDRKGWISGWIYKVDRHERTIRRDTKGWLPILQIKHFHPENDAYGLSPLSAARQAIDLHNAGADWAKALIDNSAKPSGALVYGRDGSRLTDEQFDRLKMELETAHSGPGNAGRPLLLEGGLDWKPMSLSPAEMDFLEARNNAAREIALALGVPPMLLGIPGDNTYANYREANLAFWRQTILPLVQKFSQSIGAWLSAGFEEEIVFTCDLDQVPALASERDALWTRLANAEFLTRSEKRQIAGLPDDGA
ncbi:MAG: phage portal protein [Pseudomonadota bacterium]